jgi:tetratricopeptide (TPR) repeat protein
MQRKLGIPAAILLLSSLAAAAPPAAAQSLATLSGTISDQEGKPTANVIVVIKSVDTGASYTVKTDKNGVYRQIGLRPGPYDISIKNKESDAPILTDRISVASDTENKHDINMKERVSEQQGERKKQQEDQQKFQSMKESYEAGKTKFDQGEKARDEMMKLPAAQRGSAQPNVNGLYQDALQSFQQAQQNAPEKDANLHLVYLMLGDTNERLGNYDAAIAAYQKAIELKPTSADYYTRLSLALAKAGKIQEATQACEKAAALEPSKGALGWFNLGVVLYYANNLADAVEPLKKATALNPSSPDAWYLLGASLLATMQTKQEGDKITYIVTPGTVEAYQKYLQLAPNGKFAAEAQAALQGLESLGAGVDTKIKVKKKP